MSHQTASRVAGGGSRASPTTCGLPQLPVDLVPVWAGIMFSERYIAAVDSPAPSYDEFRRDAEPQRAWKWRWWQPGAPGKVRIGSHSGYASD